MEWIGNFSQPRAAARALATQGARVFLAYFREPPEFSAKELRAALEANHGGVLLYHANQQQTAEPVVEEIRSAASELGKRGITVNVVTCRPDVP